MISFWEKESLLQYDYIIAGSGIVGISTALELRKKFPKDRILVADAGVFPLGASTRNAGFACMGSLNELLDDLKHIPSREVIDLFALRKKGLEILRKRIGDEKLGYQENGSHELLAHDELYMLDEIPCINKLLYEVTGYDVFAEAQNSFGFSKNICRAVVKINGEGELHTGKMMRSLLDLALENNIEIRSGVPISRFEEEENVVNVFFENKRGDEWYLRCNHFIICTNAFAKQLLPNEDITPGRGQVLITKPLPTLPFHGIFHFDKGYYYFREIENRILFGGGRNLDFDGEATTTFELNETIQKDLEGKLKNDILPGVSFEIDQRWCGIMAFGKSKFPIVKKFTRRVSGAFRMGGMGVAVGSAVAQELIELITEEK